MSNFEEAIDELLKFKDSFDRIDPKIPKRLLYVLGEFYVLKQLEEQGFNNIEHKGGQSGCDILVDSKISVDRIRIEVKTSLLKSDDTRFKNMSYYGWVVEKKKQKNTNKFDILVCVALDNSFKNPRYYIVTHDEAFSAENIEHKQFTSLRKRIILFENEIEFGKVDTTLLKGINLDINKDTLKYSKRWDII